LNFLKILIFTNGFRRLRRLKTVCPVLLTVFLVLVPAAWAKGRTPETTDEVPEMEMLEFLGSFEDKDTGWMDPFELEALAKAKEPPKEDGDDK